MTPAFNPFPTFGVAGGVAHVFLANEKLYESKNPSFLLDRVHGALLKHGDLAEVQTVFDNLRRSYRSNDLDEKELELITFDAATCSADMLEGFCRCPQQLVDWVVQNRKPGAEVAAAVQH